MRGIEDSFSRFGDTTSKLVEAFIEDGPNRADICLAYESNAIAMADKGLTNIRVIYPEPTVPASYPAAILKGWATPQQSEGARAFVDFLLTPDVQRRAMDSGLRPVLSEARGSTDMALVKGNREQVGFKLDPQMEDRPVGTKTIDDLIYQWHRIYGAAASR